MPHLVPEDLGAVLVPEVLDAGPQEPTLPFDVGANRLEGLVTSL